MQTEQKHEIPYEIFFMNEKDEPELHEQHTDPMIESAFGAEADTGNGNYSQNTTAWD